MPLKIFVGVNVLDNVRAGVYANHCQFWYRLGKEMPDVKFFFMPPERVSIDNMRNMAAKCALELECDYLMFIDDDMLLHPNTLKSMLAAKRDIVMAHTYIRGYPFKPMSFYSVPKEGEIELHNFTDEMLNEQKDENGLVDAAAVGFACVLIKVELLKELPPPYFLTVGGSTEDIYFCMRCRRELGDVTIAVDMKIPTGHTLAPEVVHADTVAALREYYKQFQAPIPNLGDRGEDYLNKCLPELTTTSDAEAAKSQVA